MEMNKGTVYELLKACRLCHGNAAWIGRPVTKDIVAVIADYG